MRKIVCSLALTTLCASTLIAGSFDKKDMCKDWSNRKRGWSCEVREVEISMRGEVDLDAGQNGGVSVKGWSQDRILVLAAVSAWAESDARAEELMQQVSIDTGSTIRATGPTTGRRESWGVSYKVQGPHSTDFQLETHNGGISVDQVSGAVTASAVNGGLSLSHVGGAVNARTTNGGVSVSLDNSVTGDSPVFVETTNGGVSLTVPEDFNGELDVSTTNGRLRSDVGTPKRTTKYGNRQRLHTTLGSGGATVHAETTNGSVTIRRR